MKVYFESSKGAAQYVEDLLQTSKVGSPLIMIMSRGRSEVYSVSDVTNSVLEGAALELTMSIFREWSNTLDENTPAG